MVDEIRPNIGHVDVSRAVSAGGASQASKTVTLGPNDIRFPSSTNFGTYTNMYKQHPIVRAAVDKLAKSAVAAGYVFQPRDSSEKTGLLVGDARVKTLNDTFSRSRGGFLLRQTYTDLLIYGDAFWHITPSRLGVPYAFVRVFPQFVSVVIDKDTREVTSYIVRDLQGAESQFKPEDILHFLIYDPNNDQYGLSPLQSLISTVAQDLFAQQYNEAFFANSAQTGIVFNMRNASKAEVDRNREWLTKNHTGVGAAHKPLVLEGDVTVSRSVASPADMQFIDGRKQLMAEILAVFDLPYTKLGGTTESANRSQSSENDKSFRAESITPLQTIIEEVVNEILLVTVFGFDDVIFAHKEVDQRDEATRLKLFSDGMAAGIYTLNFVLNEMGLPVAGPAGDIHYFTTPLGMIPLDQIQEAATATLAAKTTPDPANVDPTAKPGAPLAKPKAEPTAPPKTGATPK